MNEIAIEDIAVLFASEFVKLNKHKLKNPAWFSKMNFQARRKVIEKTLDSLEQDIFKR